MFEEAVTELEKYGENISGKAQLKNELSELESVMTELRMKNREYREELYSLGTLKHNIDIIYSDKSEDLAEKKLSEKPTEKQKNKDNEIEI